jgi:Secretion system C-terminal sorting domain
MNKKSTFIMLAILISASAFSQGIFKKNYTLTSDIPIEYQVTPTSLINLSDGGYAFTARTQNKTLLCKADNNWNLLWANAVNTFTGEDVVFNHIVETKDKSLVLTGGVYYLDFSNVYARILVAKYDSSGTYQWNRMIYTGYDCIGLKIFEKDEGFVIAYKRGYGDFRPFYAGLVEIDSIGNYTKAVDINAPQYFATDVTKAKNGYVFSGYYFQPNGSNKNFFTVVSIDSSWNIRWSKVLNNGLGTTNRISITALKNGYLLAGHYRNDAGSCFLNLLRLKSNGTPIWSKSLNFGTCSSTAPTFSLINDTSYILGGNYPGGKTFLMRLDTSGNVKWANVYNGNNSRYFQTRDSGFVILMAAPGAESLLLVKTDSLGLTCGDNEPINVTATNLRINNIEQNWVTIANNVSPQSENLQLFTADTAQTVICSDVVLPLTLLSFTAQHSGKTNKLLWITANEINTAYFEIQRSTDGVIFAKLATVNAYGNAKSQNDYTYTDNIPLKSKNYYRIKMVDKDGRFTYSAIKQLDNLLAVDASVYPNPARGKIMLTINCEKNTIASVTIYNVAGKAIQTQSLSLVTGIIQKDINISSLGKGIYFLKIDTGSDKVNLRFLVQ